MDTKALRQKILDLAIHGKLVPQNPNDEPASVLLERIKAEKERLIKEGKIKKSRKTTKKNASDTPHYENVPFEIPKSWVWCRLEELCNIKGGKRIPKGKGFSAQVTEHIYLRVTNMKNRTISLDDLKYIDDDVFQEIKNYTISSEDLYITIAGTIGDVGEIPQEVSGMNLTENAAKLTNIVCDRLYLMYSLLSTNSQEHFSTKFHQVAQPKLSIETASSTLLPLPPLSEQQRIVMEIEKWFTLIDQIEQGKSDLQNTIKQTKSKILDLAIHGKLVPQDPNDEPAIELLKRINPDFTPCDNGQYGKIPQGWLLAKLGDLFDAVSAKRVLKSEWRTIGIPFYRAREIVKLSEYSEVDNELFIDPKHYDELKNKSGVPASGDIMLSAVGTIGKSYIVKESDKFYYKDASVLCLRNRNKLCSMYFSMLFSSSFIKEQIKEYSKGTTVDTITLEKIKSYIVPLPPLYEQQRIVQKIEELFSALDNIQKALEM